MNYLDTEKASKKEGKYDYFKRNQEPWLYYLAVKHSFA